MTLLALSLYVLGMPLAWLETRLAASREYPWWNELMMVVLWPLAVLVVSVWTLAELAREKWRAIAPRAARSKRMREARAALAKAEGGPR